MCFGSAGRLRTTCKSDATRAGDYADASRSTIYEDGWAVFVTFPAPFLLQVAWSVMYLARCRQWVVREGRKDRFITILNRLDGSYGKCKMKAGGELNRVYVWDRFAWQNFFLIAVV